MYGVCCCAPWPLSSFLFVPFAHARLYSGSKDIAKFNCSMLKYGPVNNIVIAALKRNPNDRDKWDFKATGTPACMPIPCKY